MEFLLWTGHFAAPLFVDFQRFIVGFVGGSADAGKSAALPMRE